MIFFSFRSPRAAADSDKHDDGDDGDEEDDVLAADQSAALPPVPNLTPQQIDDVAKSFPLKFLHFHGILFTKTGYDGNHVLMLISN